MTSWVNACTSREVLSGGLHRDVIGIAPRAVMLDGYWRAIADTWQQGDADLPHLVSQAPIRVATADSGRRRLYPVAGDLSRYIEIGAPLIKPAGSWVSVGFSGATRTGNRITWSRPQANLSIVHGGHFCKLDIELRNGYVPPNRQFAFPVSLVGLVRQGAQILIEGKTNLGPVMLLRPPVVYDAANPMNVKPIDWTFGAIGGQTGVLFTLPDLAGMARPVVDPTFSSQPGAADGNDGYMDSGNPNTAGGITDPTNLAIGEHNAGAATYRTVVEIDQASLPSDVSFTSVILSTWLTLAGTTYASNNRTIRLYRQKRAFVGASATWNKYDGTNAWQTAGGFGVDDCEQSAIGSCAFATTDAQYSQKDFVITAADKAALDLGNGWLLKADTETDDLYLTGASNNATAAYRPLLTVQYGQAAASSPSGGTGRGRSTLCREARNRWL